MTEQRQTTRPEPFLHCWMPGPQTADGCPTTCMLGWRHYGAHQFTRDDEIRFTLHREAPP